MSEGRCYRLGATLEATSNDIRRSESEVNGRNFTGNPLWAMALQYLT